MRKLDLVGRRFDKLVCLADVGLDRHGSRLWLCICDCGNHVTKRAGVFLAANQKQMACRTCGDAAKRAATTKHGDARAQFRNSLHTAWSNMRARCRTGTAKNQYWAGKGIKICDEWQTYPWFREWALAHGYAKGLSLDRINPDGDYEPSNCRWVTVSQNTVYSLERRWKRS